MCDSDRRKKSNKLFQQASLVKQDLLAVRLEAAAAQKNKLNMENLSNGFYTELAIDETGPKKLLISEHEGHYTVNDEGRVKAIIRKKNDEEWEQVDGDALSPFALKLIGAAIASHAS